MNRRPRCAIAALFGSRARDAAVMGRLGTGAATRGTAWKHTAFAIPMAAR